MASGWRVSSRGPARVEAYKAKDVNVVCWSRPSDGNSESIYSSHWMGFLVFYGLNCAVSMALFSLCRPLSSRCSPYSSSFVAFETDLNLSLSLPSHQHMQTPSPQIGLLPAGWGVMCNFLLIDWHASQVQTLQKHAVLLCSQGWSWTLDPLVIGLCICTTLPRIFYTRIESALGQCPGGPDGFLTNKSMRVKAREGYW